MKDQAAFLRITLLALKGTGLEKSVKKLVSLPLGWLIAVNGHLTKVVLTNEMKLYRAKSKNEKQGHLA